jgi:hypothetical protein
LKKRQFDTAIREDMETESALPGAFLNKMPSIDKSPQYATFRKPEDPLNKRLVLSGPASLLIRRLFFVWHVIIESAENTPFARVIVSPATALSMAA